MEKIRKHLSIGLFLLIALSTPAFAKKKHKDNDDDYKYRIFEVNAASITVSVGLGGEEHSTYSITASTKVTIDGLPAAAGDLMAGMVAKMDINADGKTADSIDAKHPPAKSGKKRVG